MSLLAISDTHKREKANLLATKSPTFGSHSSAKGHVPHAQKKNAQGYFEIVFAVSLHSFRNKFEAAILMCHH